MNRKGCPACSDPDVRALAIALGEDDLDRAISLGLLDFHPTAGVCEVCAQRIAMIALARDARLRALAARERHRAREARLAARAEMRARRRAPVAPLQNAKAPPLPAAAASVLARARARAAAKRTD